MVADNTHGAILPVFMETSYRIIAVLKMVCCFRAGDFFFFDTEETGENARDQGFPDCLRSYFFGSCIVIAAGGESVPSGL